MGTTTTTIRERLDAVRAQVRAEQEARREAERAAALSAPRPAARPVPARHVLHPAARALHDYLSDPSIPEVDRIRARDMTLMMLGLPPLDMSDWPWAASRGRS